MAASDGPVHSALVGLLRRRYRRVVAIGLASAAVGVLGVVNPLWLVHAPSIGFGLFVAGCLIALVGLFAGVGTARPWLLAIGFTSVIVALMGSAAAGFLASSFRTTLFRTTSAEGPGSIELRVREESPVSDACVSVELRSGRGLLTRSRDVVSCTSTGSPPKVEFDGALAVVTFSGGVRCSYRIDFWRMSLSPVDPSNCRALPS
jgi:hypothetical protein